MLGQKLLQVLKNTGKNEKSGGMMNGISETIRR
jgi:hypothetical protein